MSSLTRGTAMQCSNESLPTSLTGLPLHSRTSTHDSARLSETAASRRGTAPMATLAFLESPMPFEKHAMHTASLDSQLTSKSATMSASKYSIALLQKEA